jgi:hypothetical protein
MSQLKQKAKEEKIPQEYIGTFNLVKKSLQDFDDLYRIIDGLYENKKFEAMYYACDEIGKAGIKDDLLYKVFRKILHERNCSAKTLEN